MTLHQINLFLAICSHNSLTEAAETLHISQPSLSVAIKQLEDEFGVNLFLRYRRRLILTEEGKKFREDAEKIHKSVVQLERKMKDIGKVQGRIWVAMPAMSSMILYPKLIIPFCVENPDVQVVAEESSVESSVTKIMSGQLNLAVTYDNDIFPDQYYSIPVAKPQVIGCCRKDHPLAYQTGVKFQMLADEKLVLDGDNSKTSHQILSCFKKENVEPRIFMYSHQFLLICQMIEEFNAVGFFFEGIFKQYDNLAPFYLESPIVYTQLLIRRKDSDLLSNEKKFIRYCEQHRISS